MSVVGQPGLGPHGLRSTNSTHHWQQIAVGQAIKRCRQLRPRCSAAYVHREVAGAATCGHALQTKQNLGLSSVFSRHFGQAVRRQQQVAAVHAVQNSAVEAPPAAAYPAEAARKRLLTGLSAQRVQRLEVLVELKKLYRNCIRAESLLALPSPVYVAPEGGPQQNGAAIDTDTFSSIDSSRSSVADDEVAELTQQAVEVVAEMQLTSEQLRTGLRSLPSGFGALFGPESGPDVESAIRKVTKSYSSDLKQRAAAELPLLPFSSESQAQAACDVRNSRYDRRLLSVVEDLGSDSATGSISSSSSFPDRLNQAEKVAGKFVARRIRPALQRAREKDFLAVVSESGEYLKGLWTRLNGGGGRSRRALPPELVQPPSSKKEIEKRIGELGFQLESLEKRLVEASKAREARLRKAGAAGRVAVAIQLRSMDAEVIAISRLLAVRTLQLEMEYVFSSVEEEALDVSADEFMRSTGMLLAREGSTGELALLVAEYGLLLEQLDVLVASLDSQMGAAAMTNSTTAHSIPSSSSTDTSAAAGAGLSLIDEEILEELATEIPDLRYRVGVPDALVFGSNPLSLTRLKLQAKEGSFKVLEGVNFLTRGIRLLGNDMGNAGRLFSKAALGGTLKQREVAALRRTARDLLTFIPFIIILIIPMTPLGHVLVFGFIQRYFPGFFPSQFTNQRQDLMIRYEALQRQLANAQAAAEVEEEEAELARAAAAVARLTAPDFNGCAAPGSNNNTSGSNSDSNSRIGDVRGSQGVDVEGGPAAAKVRLLQEQIRGAREDVHAAPDEDSPSEPVMTTRK